MRLRMSHWFAGKKPVRNKMITAAVILLTVSFMLLPFGGKIIDVHDGLLKSDRLTAMSQIISGVPDNAVPVTLLDVDDTTRLAWRAETATPHPALAELISIAAARGARAILLDFDLTVEWPPADEVLSKFLNNYKPEDPLLMLVRTISFVRAGKADGTGTMLALKAPASRYDGETRGKPNITWVTTLNDISSDRTVRRIRLWQSVCDSNTGTAYPSAALLMAALLTADPPGKAKLEKLQKFLALKVEMECGNPGHDMPIPVAWPAFQQQAAVVPFVFNDNPKSPAMLRADVGGKDTIILRRISARLLVSRDNGTFKAAPDIDHDPFAGRVVIIGASYTGSHDIHETPLGTMPGSLILANSIVQADALTGTIPARPLARAFWTVALFLIFAVFARYLAGIVAVILISALSLLSIIVLSRYYGVESGLDIIITALTGFALFKLIDGLAQIAANLPKSGWRAILKS